MKRVEKCPECKSDHIIYLNEKGESVCCSCGLVIEEKRPLNSEKGLKIGSFQAFYGPGQAPWSHRQESGSTFGFSKGFRDINLNYLPPKDKAKFKRLRKLHTSRGKKSIDPALAIFRNMTGEIKTPNSVKEQASIIFLATLRKGLIRGRSYEAIIAAAVLISYRIMNIPKSIEKISKQTLVPKEKIFRCYDLLQRELNIKVKINFDPEYFLPSFCSDLKAKMIVQKKARAIIKRFKEKENISGKDPKGITAAAIYIASKDCQKMTQKEISLVTGITEVTLRKRYKELENTI